MRYLVWRAFGAVLVTLMPMPSSRTIRMFSTFAARQTTPMATSAAYAQRFALTINGQDYHMTPSINDAAGGFTFYDAEIPEHTANMRLNSWRRLCHSHWPWV